MNWLLFKLFMIVGSITALSFLVSQYVSSLFDNFGQAVDAIRIRDLKITVIYLMIACFVVGFILNVAITIAIEIVKI